MNLYEFLGTTPEEVYDIITNKKDYYLTYKIKKRSGKYRRIDAPQGRLKDIQKSILFNILYRYKAHPIAHGFVKDRNPKTNASKHVNSNILINIDLIDFFNNIREGKVFDTFNYLFKQRKPYTNFSDDDIEILTQLITYRGTLCQGAPTSPTFSNLAVLEMDKQLKELAKKKDLTITRYADDISCSSTHLIVSVPEILNTLRAIIQKNGFRLNFKKTKIRKRHQRMQVTGIVVNEKPNIKRTDWRNFRAKLHNILTENKRLNETQLQQLRGYIEWVSSINPNRGKQFLEKYEKILILP